MTTFWGAIHKWPADIFDAFDEVELAAVWAPAPTGATDLDLNF